MEGSKSAGTDDSFLSCESGSPSGSSMSLASVLAAETTTATTTLKLGVAGATTGHSDRDSTTVITTKLEPPVSSGNGDENLSGRGQVEDNISHPTATEKNGYSAAIRRAKAIGAEGEGPVSGIVKWFSFKLGYGFVIRDDGKGDVFVYQQTICKKGYRTLAQGEKVLMFVIHREQPPEVLSDVHKGPEATIVMGLDGGDVVGCINKGRVTKDKQALRCYNCFDVGHLASRCPQPPGRVCHQCGEEGHLRAACPYVIPVQPWPVALTQDQQMPVTYVMPALPAEAAPQCDLAGLQQPVHHHLPPTSNASGTVWNVPTATAEGVVAVRMNAPVYKAQQPYRTHQAQHVAIQYPLLQPVHVATYPGSSVPHQHAMLHWVGSAPPMSMPPPPPPPGFQLLQQGMQSLAQMPASLVPEGNGVAAATCQSGPMPVSVAPGRSVAPAGQIQAYPQQPPAPSPAVFPPVHQLHVQQHVTAHQHGQSLHHQLPPAQQQQQQHHQQQQQQQQQQTPMAAMSPAASGGVLPLGLTSAGYSTQPMSDVYLPMSHEYQAM